MQVIINKDDCIGCELCVNTCSDIFEMDDDLAVVKKQPENGEDEECVVVAEEACPTDAITHE